MLLLFDWPPVRGVCPNHEVVMFQPRTATPPYLGSVVKCYVSISTLLNLLRPSPPLSSLIRPPPDFRLGGCHHPPLATLPSTYVVQPHRIIRPPWRHLSLSQHPKTPRSLPHIWTPLRPFLLRPFHACLISNAAPLPPLKFILMHHSDAFWPPFISTTAPSNSLPPRNLSIHHIPPR